MTPMVASVCGSNSTASGVSVTATDRLSIRVTLTFAFGVALRRNRVKNRPKSDAHGSVANSA
jgi:hypothetical protein